MKRSYSDLDQHTGDPPFAFGPAARGPRQPKQYQQQTEPGTGKIKACMQCGTTRTPQWREGPYGPKTLCNACGVKRVRAIKAQQQGKNPTQVPHTSSAGTKKKSAAAARTESIELATTLQLLAGNLDAGPPPAKRQARAGQVGPGRGRKANSMQAAANHVPEYDPFDPAAAAAMSAPALGSAVQKAIAAIAAKGSMGGESNPTDSGEEISWSPNDHTAPGDAAAAAAGEGAGSRRQRQQQQQLRAAMAAAAAAQLAAAGAGDQEDLMQLAGLQGQPLSQVQQMEAGLAEGYGADTAEPGHDGAGAAGDEEAAAVANLLSMSAAASEQQQNSGPRPASSAGKAAMRDFVAQLAAGSGPSTTPVSRSPARRQTTRTPPPRHVVTVRQRAAAAAGAEPLVEEDVLYLLGPGMAVMARYVAPEELLEVIKLNEMASEAQRSKAAAEAAVEAVEQILRDKQAAALAAQATARTAMQRLHSYVGELNAEHSLMLKAAQEQQPAALASRLAGSSAVGSLTQLDILAASLQQQQEMQDMQAEAGAELADQQQQHAMMEQQPDQEDSLAGLAAAAAAAAAAEEPEVMNGPVKAEPEAGQGVVGAGELVVDPLVLGEGVGAGADSADACVDAAGATGAVVDAAANLAAPAVDAAGFAGAVAAEPVEALPQQPQAGVVAAQPELQVSELQQLHAAAAAAAFQPTEAPATQMPIADDVSMQDAQLLGSLQELAVLAGIFDNNGVAAVGSSPALI